MSEKKLESFFNKLSPKASYFLGLASGLIVVFIVGFFILLGMVLSDDEGTKKLAGDGAVQPAVPTQPSQPGQGADELPPVDTDFEVTDSDYVRGNPDASITIVEFSDFQCPYCSRFHPTVERILEEYPDDVRWVWKHFPLTSIHPEAAPAAEAAECAGELGGGDKFWAYGDALFENQATLGSATYSRIAGELGLDKSSFEECIDSGRMQAKVQSDYQEGIAAGVRGTPGSFVNGVSIPGAVPYEQVKAVVDSML